MVAEGIWDLIGEYKQDSNFESLNWEGSFSEYLDAVKKNPKIARTAFQRVYDMVMESGTKDYVEYRKKIIHYNFFDDLEGNGQDAIYGMDVYLQKFVNVIKAAAQGFGTEKRVILLHGPVGSSKSTIVRLLKKGLEKYTQEDNGAMYTYKWKDLDKILKMENEFNCPMHEEPLRVIPIEIRPKVLHQLNKGRGEIDKIRLEGDLCPACRHIFNELLKHYSGDLAKVLDHVQVKRFVLSERDRIGIGTFQPKDEKNQDSTELSGDVNYRKIAIYGSDSDPRAFNFDGEFNIEVL